MSDNTRTRKSVNMLEAVPPQATRLVLTAVAVAIGVFGYDLYLTYGPDAILAILVGAVSAIGGKFILFDML